MPDAGTLLFGGTFDPPHRAHAVLPPRAADQLGCDRLIYIPASVNPLKADSPPAGAAHRLAMLKLAIRDVPHAEISTIELDRDGPSYFIDTVRHFRDEVGPDAPLRFLIGSDQAAEFHRWKDWQAILQLAEPAVMIRPSVDRARLIATLEEHIGPRAAAEWKQRILDLPVLDVASTDARRRLEHGESPDDLLDPAVLSYIRRHHLYGQ